MDVAIYFHAAQGASPGPAALSWQIVNNEGEILTEGTKRILHTVPSSAQYEAAHAALDAAEQEGAKRVIFASDQELVINQVTGKWRTHQPGLIMYRDRLMERLLAFDGYQAQLVDGFALKTIKQAAKLANMTTRRQRVKEEDMVLREALRICQRDQRQGRPGAGAAAATLSRFLTETGRFQ